MTNSSSDNRPLDTYLTGKDPLSAAYQQTTAAGPSELTDARILAAAKDAISKSAAGAAPKGRYRWMIPASLAAMLLLTVSVVLVMQRSDEIFPAAPAVLLADSDQRHDARANAPADNFSGAATLTEQAKPSPREKNIELVDAAKTSPAPAAKPAEPPLVIAQAESHDSAGAKGADISRADSKPVDSQVAAAAPAAVGASSGVASGKFDSKVQIKNEADSSRRNHAETKLALQEASEQEGRRQQEPIAGLEAKQKTLAKSITKPAEVWLEEISKLLKAGKIEPAREELKTFRSAYPTHSIDAKRFPEIVNFQEQDGSKPPP